MNMCFHNNKTVSEYMKLFHCSHNNIFLFSNSICIVFSVNYDNV